MSLRRSALSVCPSGDPWGTPLQSESRHSWAPVKPTRGQILRPPRPKVTSVLTRGMPRVRNRTDAEGQEQRPPSCQEQPSATLVGPTSFPAEAEGTESPQLLPIPTDLRTPACPTHESRTGKIWGLDASGFPFVSGRTPPDKGESPNLDPGYLAVRMLTMRIGRDVSSHTFKTHLLK